MFRKVEGLSENAFIYQIKINKYSASFEKAFFPWNKKSSEPGLSLQCSFIFLNVKAQSECSLLKDVKQFIKDSFIPFPLLDNLLKLFFCTMSLQMAYHLPFSQNLYCCTNCVSNESWPVYPQSDKTEAIYNAFIFFFFRWFWENKLCNPYQTSIWSIESVTGKTFKLFCYMYL